MASARQAGLMWCVGVMSSLSVSSQSPDPTTHGIFAGGQGTIDVSSWSPNSQYLALVSYQVVPQ